MLREHVINFLEAAVVLLALTNAFSVGAAAYAIALARALSRTDRGAATQPRLLTVLARCLRIND